MARSGAIYSLQKIPMASHSARQAPCRPLVPVRGSVRFFTRIVWLLRTTIRKLCACKGACSCRYCRFIERMLPWGNGLRDVSAVWKGCPALSAAHALAVTGGMLARLVGSTPPPPPPLRIVNCTQIRFVRLLRCVRFRADLEGCPAWLCCHCSAHHSQHPQRCACEPGCSPAGLPSSPGSPAT